MTFRQRPGFDRSLSGPVRGLDLDEELARLRGEKEWREGRRNAMEDETVEAGSETVLTCDAGVRHGVEALGDAVCLLTVAGGGQAWRRTTP